MAINLSLSIELPLEGKSSLVEPGQSLEPIIGKAGQAFILLGVFNPKTLLVEGSITGHLLLNAVKPVVIRLQDVRLPHLTYFAKISSDLAWHADMHREYETSQHVLKSVSSEELSPCPSTVLYYRKDSLSLIVWPEFRTDLGQSLSVRGKTNSVRDLYQLLILAEKGEVAIRPGTLEKSLRYLKSVLDLSGIVHFDVKPENILVSSVLQETDPTTGLRTIVEANLLLADFGSAYPKRNPDGSPCKLRAHQICGTEEYTEHELKTLRKREPMGVHVVGEGLLTDSHAWRVVHELCHAYERKSIRLAKRAPIPYLPKTAKPPPIPRKARPLEFPSPTKKSSRTLQRDFRSSPIGERSIPHPTRGPIGSSPALVAQRRLREDSPQFGAGAFLPMLTSKRSRKGE